MPNLTTSFQSIVTTDHTIITDGTGSLIPSLNLTSSNSISSSYAVSASFVSNSGTGVVGTSSQSMWNLMIPSIVLSKNFTQSAYQIAGGFIDNYWNTSSVGIMGPVTHTTNYMTNISQSLADMSVALLLHFSGSSGSVITVDSGPYNLPVSFSGTTAISNVDYKFGSSSLYDPANGSSAVSGSQLWISASADMTLEFWIKMLGGDSYFGILGYAPLSTPYQGFQMIRDTGGRLYLEMNNPDVSVETTSSVLTNDGIWHHIAIVRYGTSSNNVKVYLDGSSILQGTSNAIINYTGSLKFGQNRVGDTCNCYMDEVRLSRVAKYTGSFTPSEEPFVYTPDSVIHVLGSVFSTYRQLEFTASKAWLVSPIKFLSGSQNTIQFGITRDSGSTWSSCSISSIGKWNSDGNMYGGYVDLSTSGTGSSPLLGYTLGVNSGSAIKIHGVGLTSIP